MLFSLLDGINDGRERGGNLRLVHVVVDVFALDAGHGGLGMCGFVGSRGVFELGGLSLKTLSRLGVVAMVELSMLRR